MREQGIVTAPMTYERQGTVDHSIRRANPFPPWKDTSSAVFAPKLSFILLQAPMSGSIISGALNGRFIKEDVHVEHTLNDRPREHIRLDLDFFGTCPGLSELSFRVEPAQDPNVRRPQRYMSRMLTDWQQ